jgi:hypothetical protein
MPEVKVEALRTFRYGRVDRQQGEQFTMGERDARLMMAARRVRLVAAAEQRLEPGVSIVDPQALRTRHIAAAASTTEQEPEPQPADEADDDKADEPASQPATTETAKPLAKPKGRYKRRDLRAE